MDEIVEIMALAALNRDRVAGGWPPVKSRDDIPDSHGYVEGARAALSALREHYAVVPREASKAMLDAFVARALQVSVHGEGGLSEYGRNQWATMIAAAEREV